ncbi:EamA family transporter [Protaetiibacter larvae]|uniref:EamA family transporter n=1 Tax=Protaetiibacter larvae TaxID=2592654 RepID=A0A5C1Y9N4_9MICO|nr:EamA family transporter [Protaetiibacter larvae]QEO10005.1 EamA family transporter [Protaetiibacter larvae]
MSTVALLIVLAAAIAHASWNVLAHGASRGGIPFLWCAAVASTVLWAVAVPFTGGIPTEQFSGFLLGIGVSAVLHVAYMLVLQRGYALGGLSTVYATARGTGPLLTVLVAVLFLGERPSPFALVGVGAVIAGVVALGMVDRTRDALPARRGPDPAIIAGLLTGVTIAAYTLWDAFAVRSWSIPPVAFMVGCTLLEIPLYTAALGRRWGEVRTVLRRQWRILLAFGVLSPLSYILVLTAVQLAPVALVAPLREVSVVLVSLFGAFVLREARPGWRVAASAVVVAGIVLIAV